MRFLAVALLAACADAVIKVGDTLPAVTLDYGAPLARRSCFAAPSLHSHRTAPPARPGFPPEKVNLLERSRGKKIILMGLPGAFTPT